MLRGAARAAQRAIPADRAVAALITGTGSNPGLLAAQAGPAPELAPGVVRAVARLLRSGRPVCLANTAERRDAASLIARRSGLVSVAGVPLAIGSSQGCLFVARESGRALGRSDLTALHGLAGVAAQMVPEVQGLLTVQRCRLARDIHDTFGQTLTSLIFAIDELEGVAWSAEHRLLTRAVRSHGLKAVRQMRELLAAAVRRTEADEEPPGRLSDLLQQLPHAGLAVHFESDLGEQALPAAVGACLYKVAREALVNVARHARARRVDMSLTRRGAEIELIVADDGQGFRESEVTSAGWGRFGLPTMRERVEEIGGVFSLRTAPGEGTRIAVRLPCPGEPAARRPAAGAGRPRG